MILKSQKILLETLKIKNKIAVIYPSKVVGKYAKSTLSTISAYLLFKDEQFKVETFDTYDESLSAILTQINSLNEKGYTKVVALFTENGFNILNKLEEAKDLKMYFSLINKSEIFTQNQNFIFGGISYQKQMDVLQTLSSNRNTMFYMNSYLGNKLRDSYLNSFEKGIEKEIKRNNNNFKSIMADKRIIGNTILLNTPIVKSSIIMSQLTTYEIEPSRILSN